MSAGGAWPVQQLVVNLLTAVVASMVIVLRAIEKLVALAVDADCLPMGGNAGTQTVTVAVRAGDA